MQIHWLPVDCINLHRYSRRLRMRIQTIRLRNGYKRFFDLTISLSTQPKRIVALVGPNGCGKSSVFDGMLFLASQWHQIGNKGAKENKYHSMIEGNRIAPTDIEILFDIGPFPQVVEARRAAGKEHTIFSLRSPYRYNSNLNITETRAVAEIKTNNYGASSLSDLDDKMEENYRRLFRRFNSEMQSLDLRPSEAKAKVLGELNTAIRNCLNLEMSDLGNIESNRGTIFFRKLDHTTEFSFNVLSSGEKEKRGGYT